MKFYCFCTISLNFEIYFLSFPREIVFGAISGNYLYLWLNENVKLDCKILKMILVPDFWPLKKLQLFDFLSDFVLSCACSLVDIVFFIYLYQRWIYPIDPKRVNEYGLTGEPIDGTADTADPSSQQPAETKSIENGAVNTDAAVVSDKKND